jgi:hypothetical protein
LTRIRNLEVRQKDAYDRYCDSAEGSRALQRWFLLWRARMERLQALRERLRELESTPRRQRGRPRV